MLRTALFRGVLFLGWSFLTVEEEVGGGGPKSHNYRTRAQFQQEHVCVYSGENMWVGAHQRRRKKISTGDTSATRARVAPSLLVVYSLLCLYTHNSVIECVRVCVL